MVWNVEFWGSILGSKEVSVIIRVSHLTLVVISSVDCIDTAIEVQSITDWVDDSASDLGHGDGLSVCLSKNVLYHLSNPDFVYAIPSEVHLMNKWCHSTA
jgi:hypothetical protein